MRRDPAVAGWMCECHGRRIERLRPGVLEVHPAGEESERNPYSAAFRVAGAQPRQLRIEAHLVQLHQPARVVLWSQLRRGRWLLRAHSARLARFYCRNDRADTGRVRSSHTIHCYELTRCHQTLCNTTKAPGTRRLGNPRQPTDTSI